MSVLILHKPLPQQHVKLDRNQARVLSLGFSPNDTEQIKDGDDLIFVFDDGARLTLVGYYADAKSPLPTFQLAVAATDITPLFHLTSNADNVDVLHDLSAQFASRSARSSRGHRDSPLFSDGPGTSDLPGLSSLSDLSGDSPLLGSQQASFLDKLPMFKETHRYEMEHMSFEGGISSLSGFHYAVNVPTPLLTPTLPPFLGDTLPGLDLPLAPPLPPVPPNIPPRIHLDPNEDPDRDDPDADDTVDIVTLTIKERGVFGDDPAHRGSDPNAAHTAPSIVDSVSGQFGAYDPDNADNDALSWSLRSESDSGTEVRTKYGTVSVDRDGRFVYRLDHDSINGLNQGQRETDTFYVVVSDGRGGFDEQLVTVEIEGTNDKPELSLAAGSGAHHLAARIAGSGPSSPLEASGQMIVQDSDLDGGAGEAHFTITSGAFTSTPTGSGGAVLATPKGTLLIRPDGHYTFTADQSAILAGGGATDETLTFTITVKDTHGSNDTVDITVRLTVTSNQPPIIGVLPMLSLREDGVHNGGNATDPGALAQSGSFAASTSDADADTLRYSITPPAGQTSVTVGNIQTITSPYGLLTLNTATGEYSYTLNRNPALDSLNAGQKLSYTYTLTVDDGYAKGVTSAQFSVVIEGTNDAPILTFATGSTGLHLDAAGITDTGAIKSIQGSLTVTDADANGSVGGTTGSSPNQQFIIKNSLGEISTNTGGNAVLTSDYGTLSIDKNGKYTFTLNTASPKVLALGLGMSHIDEFTITVRDAHGAISGTQTIRVEINGKNDAPTFLDSSYVLNLTEAGHANNTDTPTPGISLSTGNVRAESIDSDKAHHLLKLSIDTSGVSGVISNTTLGNVQTVVTAYGVLTLNTVTGAYTFALDNTLPAVQALTTIGRAHLGFRVTVTDTVDPTLSRTQSFSITIQGSNDAPVINGVTLSTSLEEDPLTGILKAVGKIDATDMDQPSHKGLVHSLVDTSAGDKLVTVLTGDYGWIKLKSDGTYEYTLDNVKAQALSKDGGAQGDSFTVRVMDEYGAYSDKLITIPITGKDDAPTIAATSAMLKEDNGADVNVISTPPPTATGTVIATDVDQLDTDRRFESHGGTVTGTGVGTGANAGIAYQDIQGAHGTLRLYANGKYVYTLDANSLQRVQELNDGEFDAKLNETFNVIVWSGHGGNWFSSGTNAIFITIAGTNDSPVITAHDTLRIEHAGGILQQVDSGRLTVYDVDDTSHTYFFSGTDAGGTPIGLQSQAGTYGVLVVDRTTGRYTYTLNPFSPAFEDLCLNPTGPPGEESFVVRVQDAHGGWVDQTITVTVNPFVPNIPLPEYRLQGTNLAVTEDNYNPLSTNVDASDTATLGLGSGHVYGFLHKTFIATTVVGNFGSIVIDKAGNYTYTLNNAMGAVQALRRGGTLTESFQLYGTYGGVVSDTITVTITGVNDKPIVTQTESKALQLGQISGVLDPAITTVKGIIKGADIDTGDTLTYWLKNASGALTLGYTVNDASGHYSISINNTTGEYTFTYLSHTLLNKDQSQENIFTVVVKDNSGDATNDVSQDASFKVTVNGVNTNPVITATPSLTVKEDTTLQAAANATVTDDTGTGGLRYLLVDAATSIATGTTLMAGKYGTLMIVDPVTGQYEYVLNNNQAEVNALNNGQNLSDEFFLKVWDKHGGSAIKSVSVTIQGSNDAPRLTLNDPNLSVTERGGRDASTASVYDPDNATGAVYHLQGGVTDGAMEKIGTPYGTLYMNTGTGYYYFEPDNTSAAMRGLRDGQSINVGNIKAYVTDKLGAQSDPVSINVTVRGQDSLPEFTLQPGNLSVTGTTASGSVSAIDPDYASGTTHYGVTYSVSYRDASGTWKTSGSGDTWNTRWGSVTIDANGNYIYTLTDPHGLGQQETLRIAARSTQAGYHDPSQTESFEVNISPSATPKIMRSVLLSDTSDDTEGSADHIVVAASGRSISATPKEAAEENAPADTVYCEEGDRAVSPEVLPKPPAPMLLFQFEESSAGTPPYTGFDENDLASMGKNDEFLDAWLHDLMGGLSFDLLMDENQEINNVDNVLNALSAEHRATEDKPLPQSNAEASAAHDSAHADMPLALFAATLDPTGHMDLTSNLAADLTIAAMKIVLEHNLG